MLERMDAGWMMRRDCGAESRNLAPIKEMSTSPFIFVRVPAGQSLRKTAWRLQERNLWTNNTCPRWSAFPPLLSCHTTRFCIQRERDTHLQAKLGGYTSGDFLNEALVAGRLGSNLSKCGEVVEESKEDIIAC